jgi:hypothetical protein
MELCSVVQTEQGASEGVEQASSRVPGFVIPNWILTATLPAAHVYFVETAFDILA